MDDDALARMRHLENDNERLRRLLETRDAPAELRHRLRSTLATLRVVIRKSAETRRKLDDYISHLEDRLDALVRAQVAADARGVVDLHNLLADELLHYGAKEGKNIRLLGPELDLDSRTGQLLALAMHELAVNSVEHGAIGGSEGEIEVAWKVEDGDLLQLTWSESGVIGGRHSHQGFGTEVLMRIVPYELKAKTTLEIKPDSVRFTMNMPIGKGRLRSQIPDAAALS